MVLVMASRFSHLAALSPPLTPINSSVLLFSLVLTIGDAFWAFGAANKSLAWQKVTIKPGTNMPVLACSLKVCAIFSNI